MRENKCPPSVCSPDVHIIVQCRAVFFFVCLFNGGIVSAQASEAYRQIPGSPLHGSVCKGRNGIWECLWEPCGAVRVFLLDWNGPIQLSPSARPTSETCQGKHSSIEYSLAQSHTKSSKHSTPICYSLGLLGKAAG